MCKIRYIFIKLVSEKRMKNLKHLIKRHIEMPQIAVVGKKN